MRIRPATPAEAGTIAGLHIASWRAAYHEVLPARYLAGLTHEAWTADWERRLGSAGMSVLVASDGDVAVGFAALCPCGDQDLDSRAWHQLANLHVRPDLRGQGIGHRLFEAGLTIAAEAGARGLTLWVVAANLPARRFYERLGMTADGASQHHDLGDGAGLDEVRYRIDVPRSSP